MIQRKQQPLQLAGGQQPLLYHNGQRAVNTWRNLAADLLAEEPMRFNQPVHNQNLLRMRYTCRLQQRRLRLGGYSRRIASGILPV
ncbi:hypothetical protein D3C75_743230 [compost metagenome]